MDIGEGDSETLALTDSVGRPLREKMVYMSVGDGHHTQSDGQSLSVTTNPFSSVKCVSGLGQGVMV